MMYWNVNIWLNYHFLTSWPWHHMPYTFSSWSATGGALSWNSATDALTISNKYGILSDGYRAQHNLAWDQIMITTKDESVYLVIDVDQLQTTSTGTT